MITLDTPRTAAKPATTIDKLRAAFLRGERMSMIDAYHRYGTNRLSEYVRRFRAEGLNIVTETVKVNGKEHGVYSLK